MTNPKKNAILLLLAKHAHEVDGKHDDNDGADGSGDDGTDGADGDVPADLKSAAEDLIAAIKQDDPDAVAGALHDAFGICESEPHKDGSEEDGDEAGAGE